MDPQDAIDFSREAIKTCIFVGGPILAVSLVVGLLVNILQAMTQLHDQSISFAPKILLLLLAIAAGLPWLANGMIDFTKHSLEKPIVFQPSFQPKHSPDIEGAPEQRVAESSDVDFRFQWNQGDAEHPVPAPSMPMLRSRNAGSRVRHSVSPQPRRAAPFALPVFRQADQSIRTDSQESIYH